MKIVSLGDNLQEVSDPEVGVFSRKNKENITDLSSTESAHSVVSVNPCPAEPGYTLPLQTV